MRNKDDIKQLILRVDYDDGFIAYLNGAVARANIGAARFNEGHTRMKLRRDFHITSTLAC